MPEGFWYFYFSFSISGITIKNFRILSIRYWRHLIREVALTLPRSRVLHDRWKYHRFSWKGLGVMNKLRFDIIVGGEINLVGCYRRLHHELLICWIIHVRLLR